MRLHASRRYGNRTAQLFQSLIADRFDTRQIT